MADVLRSQLKHYRDWGLLTKPKWRASLDKGKNHRSALIESNQQRFVLKQFERRFEHACHAQSLAAQQGLAPKPLYAKKPLLLMPYIECFAPFSGSNAQLKTLGEALTRLHNNRGTQFALFDLDAYTCQYLAHCGDRVQRWQQKLLPILNAFKADPNAACFSHCDLVLDNLIFTKTGVQILDWEYACRNNPWFDLAAIVVYGNLNPCQAKELLASYRDGWQEHLNSPIFFSAQVSVLWLDLLWHRVQQADDDQLQQTQLNRLNDLATRYFQAVG